MAGNDMSVGKVEKITHQKNQRPEQEITKKQYNPLAQPGGFIQVLRSQFGGPVTEQGAIKG